MSRGFALSTPCVVPGDSSMLVLGGESPEKPSRWLSLQVDRTPGTPVGSSPGDDRLFSGGKRSE